MKISARLSLMDECPHCMATKGNAHQVRACADVFQYEDEISRLRAQAERDAEEIAAGRLAIERMTVLQHYADLGNHFIEFYPQNGWCVVYDVASEDPRIIAKAATLESLADALIAAKGGGHGE